MEPLGPDEYGFCQSCDWHSELPTSHVESCPGCEWIQSRYEIWIQDGELCWKLKK